MFDRSLIVCAALALSGPALGQNAAAPAPAKPAEQAQIHFANLGGIEDWRADGESALYLEGRNRQWYRAELMAPCIGLNFAERIGFVTEPSGAFDKFSAILVEHRECQVVSLVKSDKPPAKSAAK